MPPSSDSPSSWHQFREALMGYLAAFGEQQRDEALQSFVGACLGRLQPEQIVAVRGQFVQAFGPTSDLVHLIDGHLALRDILRSDC